MIFSICFTRITSIQEFIWIWLYWVFSLKKYYKLLTFGQSFRYSMYMSFRSVSLVRCLFSTKAEALCAAFSALITEMTISIGQKTGRLSDELSSTWSRLFRAAMFYNSSQEKNEVLTPRKSHFLLTFRHEELPEPGGVGERVRVRDRGTECWHWVLGEHLGGVL